MAEPDSENEIKVDRRLEGIVVVTLNRPQRRNCLSLALWQELGSLYRSFAEDPTVRSVILTGAGGHFSAGADISEFPKVRATQEQAAHYAETVDEASDAILELPKPTIAVIEGFCVGGGLGLAVAHDFRIADTNALFSVPAARLSIVYGVKETRNLLNIVGLTQAKRLLFSGARVNARKAQHIGLVDQIAEGSALEDGLQLARQLAENAPLSIAGAKLILTQLSQGSSLNKAAVEAAEKRAVESEDYAEAVKAFAEKRKPTFRGR